MADTSGKDIVLIGGLWLPPTVWDATASALRAAGHHVQAVTLPGQGDDNANATLDDQLTAVLEAIDSASGAPLVVGHSAACTLAWLAADRRPAAVSSVALIGGFPSTDGEQYAAFFDSVDGAMPFPGWEPFAGPDSDDLSEEQKQALENQAIPVPDGVSRAEVHYTDTARHGVRTVLICPEFTPDQAREWIAAGDVPELAATSHVDYVDLPTGHWPMVSAPTALAEAIGSIG